MSLERVTAPTDEPIDLVEAKSHLRVDNTAEDSLIKALITAAREEAEAFTNRAILTQTYRLWLDRWQRTIELPVPPLRSVDAIKYLDTAGVEQTWSSDEYRVDSAGEPARITTDYGHTFPALRDVINSVNVTYICGYATPFTADASTNTLTATGHPYSDGDVVRLSNSGGNLPGPLSTQFDYHVINVSGDTLQLSDTSGGSAIEITDTGSGTHFLGVVPEPIRAAMKLIVGHLYEHRESVNVGNIVTEMTMGARSLLQPYWTVLY